MLEKINQDVEIKKKSILASKHKKTISFLL